jgi:GR25 family glycosyltransferase involved in LPS biosynthesis
MLTRKAYLLTCNEFSERTQFSKNILEKVGFTVIIFNAIQNNDKILSNRISMNEIYKIIFEGNDDWAYVFEDDINLLENINLDEIVKYEDISLYFFYLGLCAPDNGNIVNQHETKISENTVKIVSNVCGLHAIGISKEGAKKIFEYASSSNIPVMDIVLSKFTESYPANVVRYDLESYIKGHRGIFFQDRTRFPSLIENN